MGELKRFGEGLSRFGLDLLLRLPPGNAVLSPYSIATAFSLAWSGARGSTEAELRRMLHQEGSGLDAVGSAHELAATLSRNANLRLRMANRLFVDRSYPIQPAFTEAALETVSFRTAHEAARAHINRWIAEETEQKIQDLLPSGSIQPTTRLVIANALYLLARWSAPFWPGATAWMPFHGASGVRQVHAMRQTAHHRIAAGDGYRVLELTYDASYVGLLVVLPDARDGLADVQRRFDYDALVAIERALVHQKVALHLPRFEVRQKGSILGIVKALGLDRAADPGTADFRGIADPPDPADRLFVDNVAHGAYLKVDEAGTEAAAATALVMALGAAPPPPDEPIPFVVDHPFLFVLRHAATGAILFLGRVEDPTS